MDTRIASSDGVSLAVHDYNQDSLAPTILFSHATGFHGRVFDPIANELVATHHCVTFDYRGNGDSTLPFDWGVRWSAYGDDALAVARVAAVNGPVIGVGHSMGGSALVMAAIREPDLFRILILFEPIIFPLRPLNLPNVPNTLADGARKRRTTFDSFDEALANYSAKPPLNVFHSEALSAYVKFGFSQISDGKVTLKCSPEHEARTYETGALHETWDQLANLRTPTWVISGIEQDQGPSSIAPLIAAAIPGSHFKKYDDLGHFGPMQDPQRFISIIRQIESN